MRSSTAAAHRQKQTNTFPPVSILIPAHNAEQTIGYLLEALKQQTYPAVFEVVLVLDRCTDSTKHIARRYGAALPLRIIEIEMTPPCWSPKKYALWRASDLASYEWCVVADADIVIGPNWLSQLMSLADAQALSVIGWAWLYDKGGIFSRLAAYEAALVQLEAVGRASWGFPYMSTGRGWAIRRAWLKAGLYAWREEVSGDDDLTLQLLPSRGVRVSGAASYSPAPLTFQAAFHRKWRHLQTARYYPWYLRLSLALPHIMQALVLVSAYILPWGIIFPPLSKALALRWVKAQHPWRALWADWILWGLQVLYPVGAYVRRSRW